MRPADRSALLHFCTGSIRPPALGFSSLMGYSGQLHRFTVARAATTDNGRLPTASTCFNTLTLPAYTNEDELVRKLQQALAGAQGFDEGAFAG